MLKINPLNIHESLGKPVDFSKANIVFFFNCFTVQEIENVTAFLNRNNKIFQIGHVLVYSNLNDNVSSTVHDKIKIITDNDFNMLGNIKQSLNNWLSNNKFDILISFADDCDLYCNRIISNITAEFKAGSFNNENLELFDLTINYSEDNYNKKFEYYAHYINNLNINA